MPCFIHWSTFDNWCRFWRWMAGVSLQRNHLQFNFFLGQKFSKVSCQYISCSIKTTTTTPDRPQSPQCLLLCKYEKNSVLWLYIVVADIENSKEILRRLRTDYARSVRSQLPSSLCVLNLRPILVLRLQSPQYQLLSSISTILNLRPQSPQHLLLSSISEHLLLSLLFSITVLNLLSISYYP